MLPRAAAVAEGEGALPSLQEIPTWAGAGPRDSLAAHEMRFESSKASNTKLYLVLSGIYCVSPSPDSGVPRPPSPRLAAPEFTTGYFVMPAFRPLPDLLLTLV